jgi:iron complex outermembrane receptor protein
LPAVASSSFGLSGRYDRRLLDELNGFLGLDIAHVGPATLGFDARNSPSMGNYFLSNLQLGLGWGPWEGMLYVDNISDQRANTFAFGNPFSFASAGQITPLRPRTVGFRLRWAG